VRPAPVVQDERQMRMESEHQVSDGFPHALPAKWGGRGAASPGTARRGHVPLVF
jgi:hypothetical protein